MKLTAISATYGRKINLGDYNSAHVEMTLWADLEENDDPAASAEALRQMARNNVMQEMARVKPELAAKVQDLFMGLPVDVQAQIQPVDENGVAYTTSLSGVRSYHGQNARVALENDLKQLDAKHGGY
jgi:hypothetical protein